MEERKEKEDGVPRLWSFGISRSRRRSDSAGDSVLLRLNFASWLVSTATAQAKISRPKRRGGGPAGDDDVVRRDGAMPVHV